MIRTAFDAGAKKAFPEYLKILQGIKKPRFQASKATGALDRKIKEVEDILKCCELCTRRCGVNRLSGELGFCGVGIRPRIFGAHTHMGEEDELIPSATVFFAGCTMRCAYCQNAPGSVTPALGDEWTEEEVARWIEEEWKEGCRNVNFVGGEPTPYLYSILRSLKACKADIPVVWNSNSYYSEKTAEILKGVVDIYLLDFRYFDERCAVRLSSAPRYPE
ncbi:MAG: radical SAM protein, partial [Deltaproteobacteria bacterium]|nr:radical SAM protein [Deltaproteobacteria bacterium]